MRHCSVLFLTDWRSKGKVPGPHEPHLKRKVNQGRFELWFVCLAAECCTLPVLLSQTNSDWPMTFFPLFVLFFLFFFPFTKVSLSGIPGELVTARFDLHNFKLCIDECHLCVMYHQDRSQNAFGESGMPWREIIALSHHPALWWDVQNFLCRLYHWFPFVSFSLVHDPHLERSPEQSA